MRPGAADHLANERTFLAYLRTAVAFIGFGFVIARFGVFIREALVVEHHAARGSTDSTVLGLVMVGTGIAAAAFGLYRYAATARALASGGVSPLSIKSAGAVVAILALLGILVGYVLYRTSILP